MKISYYGFDNEQHFAEIQGYVEKWKHVIPPWVTTLVVGCVSIGAEDSGVAEAQLLLGYMKHRISIRPQMFDDNQAAREHHFLHELCHSFTNELHNFSASILHEFVPEGSSRRIMDEQLRERSERVTCWIEELLNNAAKRGKEEP